MGFPPLVLCSHPSPQSHGPHTNSDDWKRSLQAYVSPLTISVLSIIERRVSWWPFTKDKFTSVALPLLSSTGRGADKHTLKSWWKTSSLNSLCLYPHDTKKINNPRRKRNQFHRLNLGRASSRQLANGKSTEKCVEMPKTLTV